MSDAASLILSRRRTSIGISQDSAALKVGQVLHDGEPSVDDVPSRDWIQHLESGPRAPLSNHRRLWAYLEVLDQDPMEYLAALGLPGPGRIWKP